MSECLGKIKLGMGARDAEKVSLGPRTVKTNEKIQKALCRKTMKNSNQE